MRICTMAMFVLSLYTINGQILDNLHCKLATCQQFYQGLKRSVRVQEYVSVCYETVGALQMIPRKYGKCLNEISGKLNPRCIQALATTIRNCMRQLNDVKEDIARYYCGYTLMKHCAISVGLERFPLNYQS